MLSLVKLYCETILSSLKEKYEHLLNPFTEKGSGNL